MPGRGPAIQQFPVARTVAGDRIREKFQEGNMVTGQQVGQEFTKDTILVPDGAGEVRIPAEQLSPSSRTAAVTYQRCPRKRFIAYLWQGRGVVPKAKHLALAVGIVVHEGLSRLLHTAMVLGRCPTRDEARGPILESREEIFEIARKKGLYVEDDGPVNEYDLAREQAALIEGMLWAYWYYQLPRLLNDYEIIESEVEDGFVIKFIETAAGKKYLYWQSRTDAVLKHRESGEFFVMSFKTAKDFDDRKANEGNTDMQGLSELASLEKRLGIKVAGVKMEYILKGKRIQDKMTKEYRQYSPFIRAWVDRDDFAGSSLTKREFYWRYAFEKEMTNKAGEKRIGNTRLGKNQVPYFVWQQPLYEHSVENWVLDELPFATPLTRDVFEENILTPAPYFRQGRDVRSWYSTIQHQEEAIAQASDQIHAHMAKGETNQAQHLLDCHFPKFTHSCNYPSRCDYYEGCIMAEEELHINMDYIRTGDFEWRIPHHSQELVQIQKLGGGS